MRGFADRAPLSAAWAWLDARPAPQQEEVVALGMATGRVLAQEIISHGDLPNSDRAAFDGYAVRAADCDGASAYNPLMLAVYMPGTASLPPSATCPIAAGWTLPGGTDAVLPFEAVEQTGSAWLQVMAPIAPGTGIERLGSQIKADTTVLRHHQKLLPQHTACLAALGFNNIAVLPLPLVRLIVPGPKSGPDGLKPLLLALLARDGALVETIDMRGNSEPDLTEALSTPAPGLVLIAGRSGAGPDDFAPASIRKAGGTLDPHGLALRPGGSAGLGMLFDQPVILLPGEPLACLVAYDLLAARLVRRLAGTNAALPYAIARLVLDRKIVSAIGLTDITPVRINRGRVQPISAETGLGAMLADGFVIVPEASEGYPVGTIVQVHLYGTAAGGPKEADTNEHDHA